MARFYGGRYQFSPTSLIPKHSELLKPNPVTFYDANGCVTSVRVMPRYERGDLIKQVRVAGRNATKAGTEQRKRERLKPMWDEGTAAKPKPIR